MLFSRLQLRRLAAFVLLGWMAAFGVSVAHACGLLPGLADDRAHATQAHAALAHEPAAAAADGQAPLGDNASCVKFCDDSKNSAAGSGTITASVPSHVNSGPLLQLRPSLAITARHVAWMHDQGRRPARELPIELLRLTL